jgi:beta-galactosidase
MNRIDFNSDWTVAPNVSVFSELTGGAAGARAVTLPHDGMLELERSASSPNGPSTGYFDGGAISYRKTFTAPDEWRSRSILLEFQGVYRDAMVYLNGVLVGQRPNGYVPFRVRLDEALRYGEPNRLRVDARAYRDSRWYSGLGIHRGVTLLDLPQMHLTPGKVRVTTPDIDDSRAVVEVAADVSQDGTATATRELRVRIVDPSGQSVAAGSQPVTVTRGRSATARHRLYVPQPDLWSVDRPALYQTQVELVDGEQVIDAITQTFGIRKLQLDAQHGLRINGESVTLRGACIHHDNGILGAVSLPEAEERRIRILKSAGFNAIRSAHNPVAPAVLDACDRLGMLVVDEAFDMWTEGKQPFDYSLTFSDWWQRDLEAMVEKDINHPSVIMYSIGNEILDAGKPLGALIGRDLAEKVRELDPTRFTTNGISDFVATLSDTIPMIQAELEGVAGGINDADGIGKAVIDRIGRSQFVTDATAESHSVVDVVGHNYAAWRYDEDRDAYPDRVVVGTETNPVDIDVNWALVARLPHVIGDFTWTGWDYLGEAGLGLTTYPTHAGEWTGDAYPALIAYCGDIDITGFRRPASYYRQIVFGLRAEPYIAVHRPVPDGTTAVGLSWAWTDSLSTWTWDVAPGAGLTVDVYSDADEVELLLDGRSLGIRPAGCGHRYQARFEVPYEHGNLRAVARRDGTPAETFALRTAGAVAAADIAVERVEGGRVAFLAIQLVDTEGTPVPIDDRPVSVTVEGGATLMGLGSASPVTEHSFLHAECLTFEGRAQAIIGMIEGQEAMVVVSVDGLPPHTVSV